MKVDYELFMSAKSYVDEACSVVYNNDTNISDLMSMAGKLYDFKYVTDFYNLCGTFRNFGSNLSYLQDKILKCLTAMQALVQSGVLLWNETGENTYVFDEPLKIVPMTQEEFLNLIIDGIQNGVNKDLIVSKYGEDIYFLVQNNVEISEAYRNSNTGIIDINDVKIYDDGGYIFNPANNMDYTEINDLVMSIGIVGGISNIIGNVPLNNSSMTSVGVQQSSPESVSNIDATLSEPVQTGTISKDETKTGTIEKEEDRTFPSSPKPNYTYIYDGYEERGDLADNRDYIIGYLKRKGIDDKYIAGILSNIEAESNFNPGKQNPSGAYGLCQWTGTRKNDLENFCANNGYNTDEIDGQLEFMIHELNGKEKEALGKMYEADTAYDAGRAFSVYYERHGISSQNHTRANNAAQNLEYVQSFGTETTRL